VRIVLSGASGLIGSALVPFLAARGHEVVRLVRRPPAAGEARWDPAAREIDRAALERADAVVHLSGENILGRWTAAKRAAATARYLRSWMESSYPLRKPSR